MRKSEIKVVMIGLNMQCKKILTTGKIITDSDGSQYLLSGGIRISLEHIRAEEELLVDTPDNRKFLKSQL